MIYIYYDNENSVIAAETKKFVESTNTECTALPIYSCDTITTNTINTACTTGTSDWIEQGSVSTGGYYAHLDRHRAYYDYIIESDNRAKNTYYQLEVERKMFNWFKI